MEKGIFSFLIIFLFASVLLTAKQSKDEKILPYPIHQHQLPNGLNVVSVKYDSPGLAAFYIVVRVGSRDEIEEGVTGFAHFFEHMMFRGTDKFPREKYNDVLKSIGAGANANTSLDRTVYHMTGNSEKLDLMFELEADRFQNLNYSVHDFKTEAGAVKGEYTKNYASPYQQMYEKLLFTAFDKHTYKHSTIGYFDDIVDMPNQYDYSLVFFDRYYRPEYTTIVVVGDIEPSEVNKLAEKYFGEWKRGKHTAEIPVEPIQTETRYAHLQNGSIPPFLGLNYKGPAFTDKEIDMAALDVLNSIIFSQTGDLYKKLVLEEKKARFIGGNASNSRDPFLIMIQSSLYNKDDLQYVKDEVLKAIEWYKNNSVDEKTLSNTKMRLKYSFSMSMDNPSTIANSLCSYIQLTGEPESLNNLYAMYDKITADDLMKVANKYFIPSGLTVATISADAEGGVK